MDEIEEERNILLNEFKKEDYEPGISGASEGPGKTTLANDLEEGMLNRRNKRLWPAPRISEDDRKKA